MITNFPLLHYYTKCNTLKKQTLQENKRNQPLKWARNYVN